jgi:hypothetical protein
VKELLQRTIIQISFIYGFSKKDMIEVLNNCGNFDQLIAIALVAKKLNIGIIEAWNLYLREEEQYKEVECKVIQLWKHRKG